MRDTRDTRDTLKEDTAEIDECPMCSDNWLLDACGISLSVDVGPAYARFYCLGCKQYLWEYIDNMGFQTTYVEAEFLKEFEIDHTNKKINKIGG